MGVLETAAGPLEFLFEAWRIVWTISQAKAGEVLNALLRPSWTNYFYWLLFASLFFWGLEIFKPWRREQGIFRKDFALDAWYMLFNLFVFPLLGFAGVSALAELAFLRGIGVERSADLHALSVAHWPAWVQILTLFIARDFVQWCVHRLLHRVPSLWEFHKVHHSVEQMGFAAHLRYHWMENVVYRTLEYVPLALLGFGPVNFFLVYVTSLLIGHWNHSNFKLGIGPLKYVLNNPQMHIWHHAHDIPGGHRYGVNYGLSLSVWDYLFGTACVPSDGRDIKLGFPGVGSEFPRGFAGQAVYPFYRSSSGPRSSSASSSS
ncbi:MAG: sterol desaturase family protein [bacterium]|nr:sterol desaturase family protein [bacterium]